MCGHGNETTSHLFLHCDVASLIWRKVFDWLGVNFITPQDLLVHFACSSDEVNSRRLRKAFWLIWHATLWMIWKERNARIFKNQMRSFDEVVDDIKAVSWFWSLSRLRIASCLFYEWCWNPRECLYRRRYDPFGDGRLGCVGVMLCSVCCYWAASRHLTVWFFVLGLLLIFYCLPVLVLRLFDCLLAPTNLCGVARLSH